MGKQAIKRTFLLFLCFVLLLSGVSYDKKVKANEPRVSITKIGELPVPNLRFPAVTGADGKIYLFGGEGTEMNKIYRFNPLNNEVTLVKQLNVQLRYASAASARNGHIYIFGGTYTGKDIYRFDPVKLTFDKIDAELPSSTSQILVSAAEDGMIYLFGGQTTLKDVYVFNPEQESLTKLPITLPYNMRESVAVSDNNGNIFLFGSAEIDGSKQILRFDVHSKQIERVAEFDRRRDEVAGALAADGNIYLIGGNGHAGPEIMWDEVTRFNPRNYTLETVARLPYKIGELFSSAVGPDYKIYVFGGYLEDGTPIADIWRLDIGMDLKAESLKIYPDNPTGAQKVKLEAQFSNNGLEAAFALDVAFYVDGKVASEQRIERLLPGEMKQVETVVSLGKKGMHEISFVVDPNNTVYELNKEDNIIRHEVEVTRSADLVVNDVKVPEELVVGRQQTLSVSLTNQGDADVTYPFFIDFYDNGMKTQQIPVEGIRAGETKILDVTIVPESVGPKVIDLVVDEANEVGEEDKANNTKQLNLTILDLPKVIIESINYVPEEPLLAQEIEVEVTIKNVGGSTARNTPVRLLNGENEIDCITVDELKAGESKTVTFKTVFNAKGEYGLGIIIGDGNDVQDSLNSVIRVSNAVDLLADIIPPEGEIVVGKDYTLRVKVANQGDTVAPSPFDVVVYKDGEVYQQITVDALGAGDVRVYDVPIVHEQVGKVTYRVVADSKNEIPEPDKNNNTQETVLNILSEPKLVVKDMKLNPTEPYAGQTATVEAVIVNEGGSTAKNVPVVLKDGDKEIGRVIIQSLSAGEQTTVAFTATLTRSGQYSLSIVIEGTEYESQLFEQIIRVRSRSSGGDDDGDTKPKPEEKEKEQPIEEKPFERKRRLGNPNHSCDALLKDINGHWAENDIRIAVERCMVKGYPDSNFRPDKLVNRFEFTLMVMRGLYPDGINNDAPLIFSDADKIAAWAKPIIAQAVEDGIITGYQDGTFRPTAPITRLEMAIILARALQLQESQVEKTSYADDVEIPEWAKGIVQAVSDEGIVVGRKGNIFDPYGLATRAQAAAMLARASY